MLSPLEAERTKRGLSCAAVADALAISEASYWRIENGQQTPRKPLCTAIYTYFGGSVTEMEILYPERFDRSEVGK